MPDNRVHVEQDFELEIVQEMEEETLFTFIYMIIWMIVSVVFFEARFSLEVTVRFSNVSLDRSRLVRKREIWRGRERERERFGWDKRERERERFEWMGRERDLKGKREEEVSQVSINLDARTWGWKVIGKEKRMQQQGCGIRNNANSNNYPKTRRLS